MKYTLFIIGCSLCATHSFDMKYSLQKHEWSSHVAGLIADDTIDNYDRLTYNRNSKQNVALRSTDLAGVTISDSYVLVAKFELSNATPSCLFSIERNGKQKLAVCLPKATDDAVMISIRSANIPGGKFTYAHKIYKDKWNELIFAINETDISLLVNCKDFNKGRTKLKSKISKKIHLTNDMKLAVGYPLNSGEKFEGTIKDLDLYAPADATTLMGLCPDYTSSPFRGLKGEKGDKGDAGEKWDKGAEENTGSKGESEVVRLHGPTELKDDKDGPVAPADSGPSCPAAGVSPTASAEHEALKAIASGMKLLSDYIIEKTDQMKQLTEHITKSNERIDNAEKNIDTLKNATCKDPNSKPAK